MHDTDSTEPASSKAVVNASSRPHPSPPASLSDSRMLEAILNATSDHMYVVDREGRILYTGAAGARALGVSPDYFVGKTGLEIGLPPDVALRIRKEKEQVFTTGQTCSGELKFPTPGGVRDFEYTWFPMQAEDGSRETVLLAARDITERKKSEQALLQQEALYRTLAETLPQMVWITRSDGSVEFFNQRWYDYTGSSPEEDGYHVWERNLYPEDRERTYALWKHSLQTGAPLEIEYRLRRVSDGQYLWHLTRAVPVRSELGEITRWFGTITDIDYQKRAEERERFLADMEHTYHSAATTDEILRITVRSVAQYLRVSRCSYSEIDLDNDQLSILQSYREGATDIVGTYRLSEYAAEMLNVLQQGKTVVVADVRTDPLTEEAVEACLKIQTHAMIVVPLMRDGKWIASLSVSSHQGPRVWTAEEVALLEQVAERTTLAVDNIRLTSALEKRVKEWETLFSIAPIGIAIAHDAECRRITTNETFAQWNRMPMGVNVSHSGPNRDNLPFRVFQDGKQLSADELPLQRAAREKQEIKEFRMDLVREDGVTIPLLAYVSPLNDEWGNVRGSIGTFVDVTETRRSEQERESYTQEMETLNAHLRRAMRETHHRVKNNLQVILSRLDMQAMQYKEKVPVREIVRLKQHIQALSAIHDILTHYAKNDREVNTLSVKETMERLVPMIQGMVIDRHIEFVIEDLILPVRQVTGLAVLVNELVSNTIKHGAGTIRVIFSVGGDVASLEVTDEGSGFAPDFDPIQTGRAGLDLVRSLTRWDLQGTISFENLPGGGASACITFPLPKLQAHASGRE